jgi:hypothetical protein
LRLHDCQFARDRRSLDQAASDADQSASATDQASVTSDQLTSDRDQSISDAEFGAKEDPTADEVKSSHARAMPGVRARASVAAHR